MAKKGGQTKVQPKSPNRRETVSGGRGGDVELRNVEVQGKKGGYRRVGTTLTGGTDLPRGKGGRLGGIKDTSMFKALRKRGFSEAEASDLVKGQRSAPAGSKGFSILQGKGRKPGKGGGKGKRRYS